jgi:hypothetical protein
MPKPTVISDVRSVLRRSLPESDTRVIEFNAARTYNTYNNVTEFPQLPEETIVGRVRQVMNSLQAATALSHLFPGTPLLVLAVPQDRFEESTQPLEGTYNDVAPLPMREINTRNEAAPELTALIRASFVDEFREGVPAVAESLLGELGVIERQDRGYYLADNHDDDSAAAYNYRQRRRKDILAELLEMKRGSN